MYFNRKNTATALHLHSNSAIQRESQLSLISIEPDINIGEEETASTSPVFDTFQEERGAEAVLTMTKFDPQRF